MKKLLVILIIVLFTCAGAYAGGDPNFTKTYPTSKGEVTFTHGSHAKVTKDCAFCHGLYEANNSIVNKDFGHKSCKTCHKKMNGTDGTNAPTTCTGCHKR